METQFVPVMFFGMKESILIPETIKDDFVEVMENIFLSAKLQNHKMIYSDRRTYHMYTFFRDNPKEDFFTIKLIKISEAKNQLIRIVFNFDQHYEDSLMDMYKKTKEFIVLKNHPYLFTEDKSKYVDFLKRALIVI